MCVVYLFPPLLKAIKCGCLKIATYKSALYALLYEFFNRLFFKIELILNYQTSFFLNQPIYKGFFQRLGEKSCEITFKRSGYLHYIHANEPLLSKESLKMVENIVNFYRTSLISTSQLTTVSHYFNKSKSETSNPAF